MEYRLQEYRGQIDLRFLRAVHLLTARDKQRSIEHSLTTYHGMPPEKAARKAASRAKVDLNERGTDDGQKNTAKAKGKDKALAKRK